MSITYTPNNFSGKDAVNAVLTGVDFDVEFGAISTALQTAATSIAPTFTGTANFDAITTTGNVTVGGNLDVEGRVIEDTAVNTSISGAYALGSATAGLVFHTASGSVTYSDSLVEGSNLTLMLDTDGNTITWPAGVKWVGGAAPTLDGAGFHNIITLWKVNNILFGSWGGSVDAS